MLHLLPIKLVLTILIMLVGWVVLTAMTFGLIQAPSHFGDLTMSWRISSVCALITIMGPYILWRRWPWFQKVTFPYLGGTWSGQINYQGPEGPGTRLVTVEVYQTILKFKLIMDSKESTSSTLLVYPERDNTVNRNRLYYVYLNQPKEEFSATRQVYKGLAILRVESAQELSMTGNYFTERQSTGTLQLSRDEATPWWNIFR